MLLKVVGNNFVYLKADVEPRQSLKVSHHKACVLASTSGVIQTSGAGPGRSCSLPAAILWKVCKLRIKKVMMIIIINILFIIITSISISIRLVVVALSEL